MKVLISLFVLGVMLVFSSCRTGIPLSYAPAQNNDTYLVDYLFEHEGCKVYRFYDNGNYVYFTNCTGSATAIGTDSLKTRVHTVVNTELSVKE